MRYVKLLLCCTVTTVCVSTAQGQLLKKLKDAANDAINKAAGTGTNTNTNNNTNNNNTATMPGTTGNNRPGNRGGEGLVTTPPDVKENLSSAETAFKSGNYGEARFAVQQAMLGVEMQIGQQILKSLPATIASLPKDSTADQVTSTGWGWVGLTIQRQYQQGDRQFKVTIANNSGWMQAINLYFNNMGFAQASSGQQNWKQTKLKGNRAIIEYDESTGYKLSVPLGQTSLLVLEGVNFANEGEVMNAANQLDVDRIKKQLGEK